MVEREHLVGKIRNHDARIAGPVVIGGRDTHTRTCDALFAVGNSRQDSLLRKGSVLVVHVEPVGLRVVDEQNVRPGVLIDVDYSDAESFGRDIQQSGARGDVFESSVAAIMPEAG